MQDEYRERRRREEAQIEKRASGREVAEQQPQSAAITNADDVAEWLRALGYPEYVEAFRTNEVNGEILKTLSSEELRDDLGVSVLRHRRDILDAINELVRESVPVQRDALPEHGRVLDHLSNVRTYHSWVRIGIQILALSIGTLRLAPVYRDKTLVTASAMTFGFMGVSVFVYGVIRYRLVIDMIERSTATERWYQPDYVGIVGVFVVLLCIAALVLTMVLIEGF